MVAGSYYKGIEFLKFTLKLCEDVPEEYLEAPPFLRISDHLDVGSYNAG